jgi:DNA polymerase I-like protein with 3'-5' exonuclease and polymerase domains
MGDYDAELDTWKREYCRKHKIKLGDFTYDLIPFDILEKYAGKDTDATLRLFNKFNPIISRSRAFSWLYNDFLKDAITFLMEIQDNGVPFSKRKLEETQKELNEIIEKAKEGLYAYKEVHQTESELGVIFNPNSTAHLRHLLFNKLKLKPIKKTGTGQHSTDAETLEHLADKHEIANHILKIRKLQKIKSTYIDKVLANLDNDGRLRTGFNLTTTTSGRLSSSGKLNMQQLPRDDKRVKKCIKSDHPDYKIFSQDLQTAEMYYAAVLSDDKALMDVFRKGGDFHSTVAQTVFNLPCKIEEVRELYPHIRQASKAISFGILYGAGPKKIAETAGISMEEAKEVIDQYFAKFHKLKKWIESTQAEIERNGFIYSVFGRKRRVPNVFSVMQDERGHAVRSALNFLVQSVASDINLMAAIDMHKWLKANKHVRAEIFALVHDSILGTVHKDDVEIVKTKIREFTQKNRKNVWIPGCPIGVDFELGESYAFES